MHKESKACTPLFSDSHRVKGLEICSCHFPLAEGSSAPRLPWQCTPLSNCTKVKRGTRDRTELERGHHQQRAGARGCGAAIPPPRSVLCLQACSQLTFTSKSSLFLESSLCFREQSLPTPDPFTPAFFKALNVHASHGSSQILEACTSPSRTFPHIPTTALVWKVFCPMTS